MQGMRGGEQTGVDFLRYRAGDFAQASEGGSGEFFLIDDDALPPAPGVVRGGFPGRAVEAAAVMEIKHKINFGPGDDALQTAHRGVFGIAFPQGGELAVHVAVESARPLDDAGEIEIGNHQHGAPVITVMGGQQRSGGKTARLIALNAAHDEDGRAFARAVRGESEIQRRGQRRKNIGVTPAFRRGCRGGKGQRRHERQDDGKKENSRGG